MGKSRHPKRKGLEQKQGQQGAVWNDNNHEEEPVVRLVAAHGNLVAVAVGTSFRVLDWR
jgi:hypothetical protein